MSGFDKFVPLLYFELRRGRVLGEMANVFLLVQWFWYECRCFNRWKQSNGTLCNSDPRCNDRSRLIQDHRLLLVARRSVAQEILANLCSGGTCEGSTAPLPRNVYSRQHASPSVRYWNKKVFIRFALYNAEHQPVSFRASSTVPKTMTKLSQVWVREVPGASWRSGTTVQGLCVLPGYNKKCVPTVM